MRGQRLEVCAAVTCAAIKSIYAPPIRYIYRPKVAQEASQVEKPLLISILAPTRLDSTRLDSGCGSGSGSGNNKWATYIAHGKPLQLMS